ncbi:hypothetical protein [Leyella stercorea]|uniref:hypothetical protein n=1 Tax=Leyella stercorea TaxID=363265 RepID=UPI00243100A3|nr:hypothetical protein [Leyella stercorea]
MLHILMIFLCFQHPRRPSRASAPTVTSIRADRYGHPRRPSRASASTVTSIRVDRREPSAYACKSS